MDSFEEKARKTAEEICKDLSVRNGIGNEWDNIDDDIQDEIRTEWAAYIATALREVAAEYHRAGQEEMRERACIRHDIRAKHWRDEQRRLATEADKNNVGAWAVFHEDSAAAIRALLITDPK